MFVTAIVLAAGMGLRFKLKTPKPLVELRAKPIIIYSLSVLNRHPSVGSIIVVVNNKNSKRIIKIIKQHKINKVCQIVNGGRRRQDSVLNAFKAIDIKTELVLIHDAVRPFIDKKLVSSVITEAKKFGAAIVGVPVKATIKEVQSSEFRVQSRFLVKKTLNRESLWEIQTPQVFRKDLILKAYEKFGNIDATDDSILVERLGAKVSVVLGSYNNIKVTTPEDLVIAEAIAKRWNTR